MRLEKHYSSYKRKILSIIMSAMILLNMSAVDTFVSADNEITKYDFNEYEQSQDELENYTGSWSDGFYVPSIEKTQESIDNDSYNAFSDVADIMTEEASSKAMPTSYDSRDYGYVTSVKNQGKYGVCWSFSAISAAETQMIIKGLNGTTTPDLSELQLVYYTYKNVADPLNLITNDKTNLIENASDANSGNYLMAGGNAIITSMILQSWKGLTTEDKVPYSSASQDLSLDNNLAYNNDAIHLQNVDWINMSDTTKIKEAIINQGSVAFSYGAYSAYYNSSQTNYYCPNSYSINHSINVVGWNDNYLASNFKYTPSGNGAWLVKNSWGTGLNDNGYFWLSYYDKTISSETVYAYDYESADNYDYNYQYDGTGGNAGVLWSGRNIAYESNIFTSSQDELLQAVSFATINTNVEYSVRIYLNPTDSSNPTSGTLIDNASTYGSMELCGYHTVKLNSEVEIQKGDKFAVVIMLKDTKGSEVVLMTDRNAAWDWVSFTNSASAGQSYISPDGNSWSDISASNGYNCRIKAYTSEETIQASNELEIPTGLTAELIGDKKVKLTFTPVTTGNGYRIYRSTDENGTYSYIGELSDISSITYADTIELTSRYYYKVVSYKNTDKGIVISDFSNIAYINPISSIDFKSDTVCLIPGDSYQILSGTYPQTDTDSITFSSSDKNVATINKKGVITAISYGTATIKATTLGGLTSTCVLTVASKAPTGVKASINSLGKVVITYDKVNTADGYKIYVSPTTSGAWSLSGTNVSSSALSYTTVNVIDRAYYFTVTSYNLVNGIKYESSYSTTVSVIPVSSIKLDKTSLSLTIGNTYTLNSTVLPSNNNDTVGYTSSNSAVAAVNQSGLVTAKGIGTATITLSSYTGVSAQCIVTVTPKYPTSITSSKYSISSGYIEGIVEGTTVDTLINGINEKSYIKVFNGASQVSGNVKLATGMVVRLYNESEVKQEISIVVKGDATGDGVVNISDMLMVKKHLLGMTTLSGAYFKAGDMDLDSKLSITDFLKIKAEILK